MAARRAGALTRSVREALDARERSDVDAGAVALAEVYARAIDADPDALADIGPKLLAVMESLHMTPRARAAAMRGGTPGDRTPRSPLDELRRKRDARLDDSAPVDAPAS